MNQNIYINGKLKSELVKEILPKVPPYSNFELNVDNIKRKYLDLPFCSNLTASKTLDIYLPDEGDGPFPVLIHFFGGGFLKGDKRDMQIKIPLLVRNQGFAIVGVNYTKSCEEEYPRIVYDIKASIRYLRANAEKYKLDPNKFIAMGSSVGGHLASLLGTSSRVKEIENYSYGYEEYSSNVQGVIDFCGSTDALSLQGHLDEHIKNTGIIPVLSYGKAESIDTLLFSALPRDVPDKAKAFSPITHVNENVPPFLIVHGMRDNYIPPQQSIELAKKIEEMAGKDKVELYLLDEAGHCDKTFFEEAVPLMLDFLKKYF
ncbi:TPA: alpha/beta hydrolase fold domain-containing protein [Bacillus cereus]